jgi:hypothetical protein
MLVNVVQMECTITIVHFAAGTIVGVSELGDATIIVMDMGSVI